MTTLAGDELHGDTTTSGPSVVDACPACCALPDDPHARGCPEAPGGPYDTGWDPDDA